jgi:hypothetical protein
MSDYKRPDSATTASTTHGTTRQRVRITRGQHTKQRATTRETTRDQSERHANHHTTMYGTTRVTDEKY